MRSRWWRDERGSSVAQAAGVALLATALLAALLLGARDLRPRVDATFRCLAASITGGGGCSGGAGGSITEVANTSGSDQADGGEADDGGRDGWGWQLGSIGLDFIPVVGEIKGLIEVFTGTDLVTGEDLGWWRFAGLAGLVGLNEIKYLRYGDDVIEVGSDVLRRGDDIADAGRSGRRALDQALEACGIGAKPLGKGRGLAKPLNAPCLDIATNLKDRAKTIRSNPRYIDAYPELAQGGRNVAVTRVNIDGTISDEVWDAVNGPRSVDGLVPPPSNRLFTTRFAGVNRDYDTEVKVLEEVANRLGVRQPGRYEQFTGRIDLYSELKPCASCGGSINDPNGVIQQFRQMFPNIEVNVYYSNKGNIDDVTVFNR